MSKYLYCAAVQGIQNFIFKTNELMHIVGASELVEYICTSAFNEYRGSAGEEGFVVKAAGNIKFIFNSESDCKKAVREFPKKVMTMAPGITISQTVVKLNTDSDEEFEKAIDCAEENLKKQRNKPASSITLGWMGMKRANNTGLPVTFLSGENKNKEYQDDATHAKIGYNDVFKLCEKSFGIPYLLRKNIAYNISDITLRNDWIAVIHADGNGLGNVVRIVGKKREKFREFSSMLNVATIEAAHIAFSCIKDKFDMNGLIPVRPVVLGGDDMTVIIRGDLAIPYTKSFLKAFEQKTQEKLGHILREEKVFANNEDKLTACAGIAFTKSSYPFYYGYELAEQLCAQAKKDTKKRVESSPNHLPYSCLMFHKVQDSFIISYDDIIKRELSVGDNPLFKAGPYYIHEAGKKHTIDELERVSHKLDEESKDGVKSGIRQWISLRLKDKNQADQRKERMKVIFAKENKSIVDMLTEENDGTCIAYDVLAYHTIMNQRTKDE